MKLQERRRMFYMSSKPTRFYRLLHGTIGTSDSMRLSILNSGRLDESGPSRPTRTVPFNTLANGHIKTINRTIVLDVCDLFLSTSDERVVFSAFEVNRKLWLVIAVSCSARALRRHQTRDLVWKRKMQFGADRGGYMKPKGCRSVSLDAPWQRRVDY